MEEQRKPLMIEVVDIQFRPGQKIYFFSPAGLTLRNGDRVIIDTARGPEFGYCTSGNRKVSEREIVSPLRGVIRKATERDEKTVEENRAKEKQALAFCQDRVAQLGLDMQLVGAEMSFDGSKLLLFFTADERVDFRELIKDLASVFHTRIELRQIGVRDKAKMVGGLGICGRPFCCASFLEDFQPVSIKMAKTQNLSLNPTKISGTCGRLMCCLKYEQDAYEDLLRTAPKADSFVDTPEGRGTVVEVDLLRQRVKVQMENHPETMTYFANEDIAILRSGKAKKNDPPIPTDLAPISGAPKRTVKEAPADAPVVLDSIKFRYSSEKVAEEILPQEPEETPAAEESTSSRRRRKNRGHRHNDAQTSAPAAESGEAKEPSKKHHRRHRHHHGKKQQPQQ